MRRKILFGMAPFLVLAIFILLNYARPYLDGSMERRRKALVKLQLSDINMAFYVACTSGKTPHTIEELVPWFGTRLSQEDQRNLDETIRMLRNGEYIMVWDQQKLPSGAPVADSITAYQRQAADRGGLVVFEDSRVEWMEPAELEAKLKKDVKQGNKQE